MPRPKQKQKSIIACAAVGTYMEKSKPMDCPDRLTISNDMVCDLCGLKTKFLRDYKGGKVCLGCKASTVND